MDKIRCGWSTSDPIYIDYHDKEWGVPVRDDQKLFEFLILEGQQAGLSWITILKKRDNYRKAFANFDAGKIAKFNDKKKVELLQNEGIIRNRLKVDSIVTNAQAYLKIMEETGSFSDYIWKFTDGKQIHNDFKSLKEVPAKTEISDMMSKDLKKKGFKFVGTTICYAYMQAVGMVNDHTKDCFRYKEIMSL
jgi:DNA-3-methyladenine glycosylase I